MKVKVTRKGGKEIQIVTDFIRLDALLKFSGTVSTGGEAKCLISEGKVFLNGAPCQVRGKKIFPGDRVCVENEEFLIKKCT